MENQNYSDLVSKHARTQAQLPEMWGGNQPTEEMVNQLCNDLTEEWAAAVKHLLRQWETPPVLWSETWELMRVCGVWGFRQRCMDSVDNHDIGTGYCTGISGSGLVPHSAMWDLRLEYFTNFSFSTRNVVGWFQRFNGTYIVRSMTNSAIYIRFRYRTTDKMGFN